MKACQLPKETRFVDAKFKFLEEMVRILQYSLYWYFNNVIDKCQLSILKWQGNKSQQWETSILKQTSWLEMPWLQVEKGGGQGEVGRERIARLNTLQNSQIVHFTYLYINCMSKNMGALFSTVLLGWKNANFYSFCLSFVWLTIIYVFLVWYKISNFPLLIYIKIGDFLPLDILVNEPCLSLRFHF